MNTELASISVREELIYRLYESCFPAVARLIKRKGGSLDDAKDLFQDAIVIYYEQVVTGNTELRLGERQYLTGIVKHLWSKKFGDLERMESLHSNINFYVEEQVIQPSTQSLARYLREAGQKCMELLQGFYYQNQSMDKLAERLGFSGARSATVQKYKCLEKIRNKIKENLMTYEDFFE